MAKLAWRCQTLPSPPNQTLEIAKRAKRPYGLPSISFIFNELLNGLQALVDPLAVAEGLAE